MKLLFTLLFSLIGFALQPLWAQSAEEFFEDDLPQAFAFVYDYNALLNTYVIKKEVRGIETTVVDYEAWGNDPRHEEILKKIAQIDLKTEIISHEEKLAFWINAYNIFVIDLIIKEQEQTSIKNLGGLSGTAWEAYHWPVGENNYTLGQIKSQHLSPLREARIHFALVDASLSSPDLKSGAYTPEEIYSQLEDQSKSYLNSPTKGVLIEEDKFFQKKVHIPVIFQNHISEFSHGDIRRFINRYIKIGDAIIVDKYREYDWHLNSPNTKEPEAPLSF